MRLRSILFLIIAALVSCESTAPTAAQMDELDAKVRVQYREQFSALEQQRRSGAITQADYDMQHAALNREVTNKVDTMLWSRHALAQSELKANHIPTPDRPVELTPPGVGQSQGTLYNSTRINGLGNQIQGNFMRDMGSSNAQFRGPGTMYDGY